MFDRQVREAAAGVEAVGRRQGIGGADVEAGPAGAAAILPRRIRLERGAGVDRPEEQPVAGFPGDQHRVLALPAESGGLGQGLLHHRGGIAEDLHPHVAPGREEAAEFLQLALQDFVIIPPLGVGRDGAAVPPGEEVQGILLRPVAHGEDEDAADARPQADGPGALVGPVLHPVHGAVGALGEPVREAGGERGHPVRPGDAQAAEAQVPGPVLDQPAQLGAVIDPFSAQKSRSA